MKISSQRTGCNPARRSLSTKIFLLDSNPKCVGSQALSPGFALHDSITGLAVFAHARLSPQAINQFRIGFSRINRSRLHPGPLDAQSVESAVSATTQERSLPRCRYWALFCLARANDKGATANTISISRTALFGPRKHNLRLGTEIFRNQFIQYRLHDGQVTSFLSDFCSVCLQDR